MNVYTQEELNKCVASKSLLSSGEDINLRGSGGFSLIETPATGWSEVFVHDSARLFVDKGWRVYAYQQSFVRAFGNVRVTGYDAATIEAYDVVHVILRDTSSAKAWQKARVWAYDNAKVVAYNNVKVRAHLFAQVTAFGFTSIEAHDSVKVHAYDNALVRTSDCASAHLENSAVALLLDRATATTPRIEGPVTGENGTLVVLGDGRIISREQSLLYP